LEAFDVYIIKVLHEKSARWIEVVALRLLQLTKA
jgi:hypothetical protein